MNRGNARSATPTLQLILTSVLTVAAIGCNRGGSSDASGADHQRKIADMIHLVLSADRAIYTEQVVNRLQNQDKVLKASEHWKDEKSLPLPAQMFRMGGERVREQNKSLSYGLLSLWPINKKNAPRTEAEKAGLTAVANASATNHYATETLGDVSYFTAVYPDRAVSQACVDCHNSHADSPKKDYKLNDVMGAIVIRLAAAGD
ncbi:MAG TPA: DUF3365 domain-containing protein [Polyangia bacterium]